MGYDCTMDCERCLEPVIEGPEGGYVCGLCLFTVEPPGYNKRREEGLRAVAAERRRRTLERRARKGLPV
ncbi:hypothetical protein SAMN05216252_16010 [Actinacidiphila glaucinigra]|uniref:Uncharacterized protein n=2 Tax=Kitasatosporales TaxID=85011 RepID=A0A239NYV8_9ACTN|nr:hypothetical protein SAMN05216252_16010 [Actinacidiphila glaucinigra]